MTNRFRKPREENITPEHMITETRDRTRRIETRLTKFMEAQGFDTGTQRSRWLGVVGDTGTIDVPTVGASLREIMNTLPPDWDDRDVDLIVNGKYIATLFIQPQT